MQRFPIRDLMAITGAHLRRGTTHRPTATGSDSYFTGVSTDSRTTQPGDCFFAIAGDNFNGCNYVPDAFAAGAVCAVVSEEAAGEKLTGDAVLRVADTIEAIGSLAREYRRRMNFKVVAITGSVGKTTTRQISAHVLAQHYRCHQAPRNFNNAIGLPLTLLAARPEDQIIITELGSNHPGEIAYLTQIAQPDIAVVTNVHPAHLAGFCSMEAIMREKLSISQGLRDDGIFITNSDFNHLAASARTEGIRSRTFGKLNQPDICAHDIVYDDSASSFTIDGVRVTLPLPGPGNVENALAAWAICSQFEIDINDFARDVNTLPAIHMRAELMRIGKLTVLNDCYNANPASMKNALAILTNLSSGRAVFICGDMHELGSQTKQLHAELGTSIAQANVKLLITVGEFAKVAAEAAKKSAEYDLQIQSFEDAFSACNNLEEFIEDSDIILVKGSRAAGLEKTVEKLKELFL